MVLKLFTSASTFTSHRIPIAREASKSSLVFIWFIQVIASGGTDGELFSHGAGAI